MLIPSLGQNRYYYAEVLRTNVVNRTRATLSLLEDPGSIKALFTWPKFSVTSFSMVSKLVKQGVSPRTVLDVGANVGQFAVASAKLFPDVQVHSFEPLPDCVRKLRKNVATLGNVTVHPFALGDEEGEVLFNANSYSHASSALALAETHRDAFPKARESRTIPVKVSTLDRVCAGVTFRSPVLLKLDVQGYEDRTIRGGVETLKRVDYVVLETSFKPMYEGEMLFMDIVHTMEEQGFRFERPVGWLACPRSGEILQMDALFVRAVT